MSKKILFKIMTPIILVLAIVLGFQNCSKNKGDNFTGVDTFDFESDTPELKTVVEGDDVVLTVPQAVIEKYFPGIALTCKWHYDTDASDPLVLSETGTEYRLDGAQVTESGRYMAECSQGNVNILIHFLVIINKYVTPAPEKKTLSISISDESSASNSVVNDILKADALTKCQDLGKANINKNVKCVWGTELIFDQVATPIKKAVYEFVSHIGDVKKSKALADFTENAAKSMCRIDSEALLKVTPKAGYECFWDKVSFRSKVQDVKKDIYRGYFIVGEKKEQFIETKDITREAALKNCTLNAEKNPKRSILCTWGTEKIFSRIVEPLNTYVGSFIEGGKTRVFITTKDIKRADALANCQLNHKNNARLGIICTWGNEVIMKVNEPVVIKKTYKGYFIIKGKESNFITTEKISKEDALANCKLNHNNNPKYGIRCTWDEMEIFKVAEPVVAKNTYKGYFVESGKERLFITTKDITKEDALANCKLNHKNNPKLGIRCTWGEETIFKVNEIVRATYDGYFIVKGLKQRFIQTKDILRADALSNCKLNAKNNPNKSVYCTWGKETIFERIFDQDK